MDILNEISRKNNKSLGKEIEKCYPIIDSWLGDLFDSGSQKKKKLHRENKWQHHRNQLDEGHFGKK